MRVGSVGVPEEFFGPYLARKPKGLQAVGCVNLEYLLT